MISYLNILEKLPKDVCLVAVAKGQLVSKILDLYKLGHRDFGENYVQELLLHKASLGEEGKAIRWHFIGHLQKNKVKQVLPHIEALHSLDSISLAFEIEKRFPSSGRDKPLDVFIEVNLGSEDSKSGIGTENIPSLVEFIVSRPIVFRLMGFMCIPPTDGSPEKWFSQIQKISDQYGHATQGKLSMGMSSDFEIAIKFGSTHVRLGTVLFGPRKNLI